MLALALLGASTGLGLYLPISQADIGANIPLNIPKTRQSIFRSLGDAENSQRAEEEKVSMSEEGVKT